MSEKNPNYEPRAWGELTAKERRQIYVEHPQPPGGYDVYRWRYLGAEAWEKCELVLPKVEGR